MQFVKQCNYTNSRYLFAFSLNGMSKFRRISNNVSRTSLLEFICFTTFSSFKFISFYHRAQACVPLFPRKYLSLLNESGWSKKFYSSLKKVYLSQLKQEAFNVPITLIWLTMVNYFNQVASYFCFPGPWTYIATFILT